MHDEIDPRSPVPLYEQIAARIRVAVAAQEYRAGDPLPSVRQLSSTLRVNPSTVVQAYRDLEREGFVEMRHGAGTFVREVAPAAREQERKRQARDLVRSLLAEAARLGIGAADVAQALTDEMGVATHE
ncbi:MAG TPA: GntR family transcriptional regulator [Longimicrobiales bacterium]|nr:GntR family transcriptional regulator [Longimicrobiales bacterium]